MEAEGYTLEQAESTMFPQTMVDIDPENEAKFRMMLEKLEEDDDVQEVYHNANLDD